MSLPRPVLPGGFYLITRRCTQRRFLLRPDDTTNGIFLYSLALAALRYGVHVLFTLASSNHHHTGIYDPEGRYPELLQCFHRLVACCQNARLGRTDNLWASEQTSVVRLPDQEAVLDKMVYALTNPVKDQLVEKASDWPGASSLAQNLTGTKLVVRRPRHFFRGEGLPDQLELAFVRPPGCEHLSQQDFASLLRERIAVVEQAAAAERAEKGTRILGRKTVLGQRFGESPARAEQRGKLSPRVAGRNERARIEYLERLKEWLGAYKKAWLQLAAGVRDVLFPAGTWALRRHAGVCCAPVPDTG